MTTVADVLILAAKAVHLTDCPTIVAVRIAMDAFGVTDPEVFAAALRAIRDAPDGDDRAERFRAAAATVKESL